MLLEITEQNFETEVLKSDRPVILECGAEWCQPCKAMLPVLEKFAEKHPGVKVCKVDIDENPKISVAYKVRSAPTFLVFKNGDVAMNYSGVVNEAKLLELLGDK